VPDAGPQIQQAVREALGRADLIITTGGLGPTSDDLTRALIAELLGKTLREDPDVLAHIGEFFKIRNRPMPDRVRVQALVPIGATVLSNPHGTAPGLALKVEPNPFRSGDNASCVVLLPGPPRELRPMFTNSVVPLLRRELPLVTNFVSAILRTTGLGESLVEERVAGALAPLTAAGLELGYCARPGQVDVRVAARGFGAQRLASQAEQIVRAQLQKHIFADGDEELAAVIVRELTARKKTLALAESCTGGLIAHELTNVPGASAVLLAGVVAYSNEAKQKQLGVAATTLEQHGAVSAPVAREMAEGVKTRLGADYAVSVTGIAGPSGGTEAKPVGTVFIGVAGPFETVVEKQFNPYDRETFKQVTALQALEMLRQKVSR
jgi:nicotinamide-nucleotide amidase